MKPLRMDPLGIHNRSSLPLNRLSALNRVILQNSVGGDYDTYNHLSLSIRIRMFPTQQVKSIIRTGIGIADD